MAVAVDASSPARVIGSTGAGTVTCTTSTFDPPAGVLVVAAAINTVAGAATGAITTNGTALNWFTLAERSLADTGGDAAYAGLFAAVLSTPVIGMTVTFTASPVGQASSDLGAPTLKVYVLTGANTLTMTGGFTEGSSTTNNLTTTAFTAEADTSMGFVSSSEWNALGTPTSTDTTLDTFTSQSYSGAAGYKLLGSAASSATFNLDAPGTGAARWNWVSAEIRMSLTNDPLQVPVDTIKVP